MDTDINHGIVTETDPENPPGARSHDTWTRKRDRMKEVCTHCHTDDYVNSFYTQYDDLVVLYNEKFAKPGLAIMAALLENDLRTTDRVRRRNRMGLVLPLAPRGAAGPPRRLHDGSGLHPLARHVRGGGALLHGSDPHGTGDRRPRRIDGHGGAARAVNAVIDGDPRPARARLVRGGGRGSQPSGSGWRWSGGTDRTGG